MDFEVQEYFKRGKEVTHDTIRDFAWMTLESGKVIPGYGHAVLKDRSSIHGTACLCTQESSRR